MNHIELLLAHAVYEKAQERANLHRKNNQMDSEQYATYVAQEVTEYIKELQGVAKLISRAAISAPTDPQA